MAMDDKQFEAFAQSLEAEFISLDSALIRAILIDYDHNDTDEVNRLRVQLEGLQASAIAEADSAFDPSGTSGLAASALPNTNGLPGSIVSQTVGARSSSDDTSVTGLSNDLSSLDFETLSSSDGATFARFEDLTLSEKEQRLLELFPSLNTTTVSYILGKCRGDFGQATDVLLNHVYFEESGSLAAADKISHKGIDGFDEALSPRSKRRRKKKKHKGKKEHGFYNSSASSSELSLPPSSPTTNHWQASSDKVSFIVQRTHLAPQAVQSLYNQNGGSVKATIRALVQQEVLKHNTVLAEDENSDVYVAMLASDFQSLSADDAAALIRLSKPSTAHAHELAKALTDPEKLHPAEPSGPIIPRYAPLKLDQDDVAGRPTSSSSAPGSTISSFQLAQLRSSAFNSASSYYRTAGSDRLFGGAAAYYGQLGRDYSTQLRVASSAEADALVRSQSSADVLDLHGVNVQDAVRITADKVGLWWQAVRVKEARSASERIGAGFTIVTGRGSHSKDGKGKLGPAVVRMLVAKGWKTEVSSGLVVVTGKAR